MRPDFIAAQNGACSLTEDELSNLDSFYELINVSSDSKKTNFSSRVAEVAMHIFNVISSSEKVAFDEVTYKQINDTLVRVQDCGYFDKVDEVVEEEVEAAEEEAVEEQVESVEEEEAVAEAEEAVVVVSEDVAEEPADEVYDADHDDLSPPDDVEESTDEPELMQDASADEVMFFF